MGAGGGGGTPRYWARPGYGCALASYRHPQNSPKTLFLPSLHLTQTPLYVTYSCGGVEADTQQFVGKEEPVTSAYTSQVHTANGKAMLWRMAITIDR